MNLKAPPSGSTLRPEHILIVYRQGKAYHNPVAIVKVCGCAICGGRKTLILLGPRHPRGR
jgi:hypothetical protein